MNLPNDQLSAFLPRWQWWVIYDPSSGDIIRMGTNETPPTSASASFPGFPARQDTVANGRAYRIADLKLWSLPFRLLMQASTLPEDAAYAALKDFQRKAPNLVVMEEAGNPVRVIAKGNDEQRAQNERIILVSARYQYLDLMARKRDIREAVLSGVPRSVYVDDLEEIEAEAAELKEMLT